VKRLALRLLALGAAKAIERIDPYAHVQTLIEHAFGTVRCYSDTGEIQREVGPCVSCKCSGVDRQTGVECAECGGSGDIWAPYTFADWIGDLLGGDGR